MKFSSAVMIAATVSMLAGGVAAFADGPGGYVQNVAAPLTKAGTTASIRPSSSSQSGYMSATQASDLAYVLSHTAVQADPITMYGGDIGSLGIATRVVFDDFTRPDVASPPGNASGTGQAWIQQAGSWGISSNELYRSSAPADNSVAINSGIADGTVKVTVRTTSADSMGVIVRATDNTHYIVFNFWTGDGGWKFYRCNGSCAGISGVSSAGTLTAGDVVMVIANGTTITGYVNGVQLLTVTDSFQQTAVRQGIRYSSDGNAQRFDDYTVTNAVSPLIGLQIRGYYPSGTDYATLTMGEAGNGATFSDTTHAPFTAEKFASTVSTGTAPLSVVSTTKVPNLNADSLDGLDSTAFQLAGSYPVKSCATSLGLAFGTVSSLDTTRFTGQTCTGAVLGDECSVAVDTALPTGAILSAQGDGANTILVEAGCIKATGCTFASQNTRVICFHH